MARFKLFTTYYRSPNVLRDAENRECIIRNLANPLFDEVHVLLDEGLAELEFVEDSPRLIQVALGQRPKFSDLFSYINQRSAPDDINVLANTDIYFEDDLRFVESIRLRGVVLALSRWDVQADGSAVLFNRFNSQDSWVFKGPVRGVRGDYFIGTLGCDNRLVHEFRTAGYRVLNPSFTVKSFHLHQSMIRPYLAGQGPPAVSGPYSYAVPDTLLAHWARWIYRFTDTEKFRLADCDSTQYRVVRFDWYRRMYRMETSLMKRLRGLCGALGNFHYWTKLTGGRPPRSL